MKTAEKPQSESFLNKNPLDIRKSFIVQAPAGSGKTTLLTQRLLALLAEATETPEECLCLTFTRKAAAEMRNRVLQALEWATQENSISKLQPHEKMSVELAKKVLDRDQLMGWNLLNHPNRLQIQTIDSLCANLAQRMPLLSGLGAHITIAEDAMPFYLEAASTLLQRIDESSNEQPVLEALNCLLNHCDNDWESVAQLLAEMLAKRDQWLNALGGTFFKSPNRAQLEQGLQYAIEETLNYAQTTVPDNLIANEIFYLASFAIKDLNLKHWPNTKLADFSLWLQLANLLLTENDEWRKTVTQKQGFPAPTGTKDPTEKVLFKEMKDRMLVLLSQLKHFPEFELALKYIRDCPLATYTEEQWVVVKSLVTLLPVLVAELLLIFQKRGQVDFIEVALGAHRALGDQETPSDLALKLGYQFRHILVDEFQDTSISQYRLLEKLTLTFSALDGNTLFFVGDPMQSIYRFRRAEVALFLEAKHRGLNDISLTPITLTKNYRSQEKIITWVNQTFSNLFPKHEDPILGAIPYVPCELGSSSNHEGEVQLQTVTIENEHERIITCIKQLQHLDPKGSIAILVRSRSHLKNLIPILGKEKIPYQGIELDAMEARPLIRDLLSLTRCFIHLADKIAWLSVLRAPYCSLTLKDIEKITLYKPSLPLFSALIEYEKISDLSAQTIEVLAKVMPILTHAIKERERMSLVNLVKNTWQQLMQVSKITNDYGNEEEFNKFFSICRELEQSQDIYKIGLLEETVRSHYLSSTNNQTIDNPLQLMTIHKAKGLEFDSVILPGLGRTEVHDPTQLLLWEERRLPNSKTYLILGPLKSARIKKDPIYDFLRKQIRKRSEFENSRLLYVAATRAKKRLFCFMHQEFL